MRNSKRNYLIVLWQVGVSIVEIRIMGNIEENREGEREEAEKDSDSKSNPPPERVIWLGLG